MPDIIETNPKVLGGQPVIKGTRIPIARIISLNIQGATLDELKKEYPYLNITKKDLEEIYQYYSHQVVQG
ncbi:MAG: hypothetical protein A2Z42_02880 [Candidatus Woykebacteria bacterium RBG_19FT_COMBO_43_10]|uniref:Antitoxin n=1 Tax=Candidatus Woykebacteria bacterium RBG_19FT_COMBO_43_10 TaxID=1802598 RepID=A0A1G1WJQ5_9BACT|nr:MAG: hypothetical protein A2Z42_02880 [Candidatus Woykebacteria bacterium RBG_19FT_COMBO_43_10]